MSGAKESKADVRKCADCGTVHYPPRDVCPSCLGGEVETIEAGEGTVLACSKLSHSFGSGGPGGNEVCSVHLDAGPVVFAFVEGKARPGDRARLGQTPNGLFVAAPLSGKKKEPKT